ncbi:MAG: NYN domain-containing protein, partial [Tepidimonas taiwanensis]|nr:NYN domain-containing protein [Tepidimonas taiwanensis]
FDVALIVSGDSDLTTPIRSVRARFPKKRLIVAFPPGRFSSELKRCAHGYLTIGEDKPRASQLPEHLTKPDGYVLTRPASWR